MTYRRLLTVVCLLLMPAAALAQDETHWGVVGAFTPEWKVPEQLETLFDGTVDLQGTDFSVGIARGRHLGGDWGVSFIHKKVKEGSRVEKIDEDCNFTNGCFPDGTSFITRDVVLNGVEIHKYVPFGTIRERVQIGMNFAGGVGSFSGEIEETEFRAEPIPGSQSFPGPGRSVQTVTIQPASELLGLSTVPLLKVQLAVGLIVSPAFKIKAQGGLDLPGYEIFSVAGVLFF